MLFARWEREKRQLLTFAELVTLVGGHGIAEQVAHRLVRKGALERIRNGLYLVRPFRWQGQPTAVTSAIAVEALLRGRSHYLGGLWALSFHRLTSQRYDSLIDAFVTGRLRPRRMAAARVRFHVRPAGAFEYGVIASPVEGFILQVSDPERTVLDALDRPRIFFGVARAVELLAHRLETLDTERLISHAIRGSKPSTCQRLGVLLERNNVAARKLGRLRARAHETRSLLSLNPDSAREGRVNTRWNVVENDE